MRRFLNAAGEKGSRSEGEDVGNSADFMSRVRYSSMFSSAGSWTVCLLGVFGEEKKLNIDEAPDVEALFGGMFVFVPELELRVGRVGRFCSFAGCRSSDSSLELGVVVSCPM